MNPVLTKADFVRRYQRGEFGNRSPTWDTLAEYQASNYQGLIHIRNRVAAGPTWYDVPAAEVTAKWIEIVRDGVTPETLYLSAMAPTDKTIIQGEIQRTVCGLTLTYSTVKKPMRIALAEETLLAYGLGAKFTISKHLCDNSYDWLLYLLDTYDGHVVEFSTYSTCWGTLPHYNTVFWEVRKY